MTADISLCVAGARRRAFYKGKQSHSVLLEWGGFVQSCTLLSVPPERSRTPHHHPSPGPAISLQDRPSNSDDQDRRAMSHRPTEPASAAAARGDDDSRPSSSSSRPSSSSFKLPPILARPVQPSDDLVPSYRSLPPRDDSRLSPPHPRVPSGRGTTPPPTSSSMAAVSPPRRPALPPLVGLHESRPFSLPLLGSQHHSHLPILPPLIASAPAIPTKGSLQVHSDSPTATSSSPWHGFPTKRPPLAPFHAADRYDNEQTDRFGLFRAPQPQMSYTASSRADSTGHPSDVSSSYTRDRGTYYGHPPPSDAGSNSPIDHRRRLPSPRSSHPYSSYRKLADDSSRSPERAYKRLKPSPVMPHEPTAAAAAAVGTAMPPAHHVKGQGRSFVRQTPHRPSTSLCHDSKVPSYRKVCRGRTERAGQPARATRESQGGSRRLEVFIDSRRQEQRQGRDLGG